MSQIGAVSNSIISSNSNPTIKYVRSLLRKRSLRDQEKLFVGEGEKVVRTLNEKLEPRLVILSETACQRNSSLPANSGKNCPSPAATFVCRDSVFESLSTLKQPDGVCAVFPHLAASGETLASTQPSLSVFCDAIQGPLNLGAIIRTACCLGAQGVYFSAGSVDLYNPKVVRAAAGYLGRFPIEPLSFAQIKELKKQGLKVWVSECAMHKGNSSLRSLTRVSEPILLFFGNEGSGLSNEALALADRSFYIPIQPGTDSLNVTSAVAIVLYHLHQQLVES